MRSNSPMDAASLPPRRAAPEALGGLAHRLGEQALPGLHLAQPARVVGAQVRALPQLVDRSGGAQLARVRLDALQGVQDVFAQRQVLAGRGLDVDRLQAEAAGL